MDIEKTGQAGLQISITNNIQTLTKVLTAMQSARNYRATRLDTAFSLNLYS